MSSPSHIWLDRDRWVAKPEHLETLVHAARKAYLRGHATYAQLAATERACRAVAPNYTRAPRAWK